MTSDNFQSQSHIPNQNDFPAGWRWLASLVIFFVTSRNRWRTSRTEKKRLVELTQTITILRDQQAKARVNGLPHRERILNVGLYVLLMDRDFSVLKTEMASTFEPWRLKYIARQIGVLVYESCDDLTSLLGKDFRHSLAAVEIKEEEFQHFNEICKQLNKFRKNNHELLYNQIRNVVGAHRAQDSAEFLNAIDAIDPLQVFQLGGDFFDIVRSLIGFLIGATRQIGQLNLIIKQLSASRERSLW
jgi:HSP90 family molecular chaperone